MKKLIKILSNAILAVSVLLLLGMLVVPSLLGLKMETILSGSMEPYLKTGAMIATVKIDPAAVQVGDVIAFKVEGMDTPVCHRVVEIIDAAQGGGFKTKGDANNAPDPWVVKPENLVGKVVFHLSWVGYISKFIKTPRGFGLLLGIPAAIIVVLEIKNIFSTKRRGKRQLRLNTKPGKLPFILPVIAGLCLICILWAMMNGNIQEKTLASYAQKNTEAGGPSYVTKRVIQNGGKLPMVICLSSEDKTVTFSENYFRLSPGTTKEIDISGDSGAAVIKTGGLFPLLPQKTLYTLFIWNSHLAPLVAAAAWIIPLMIISLVVLKAYSSRTKRVSRAKYLRGALNHA